MNIDDILKNASIALKGSSAWSNDRHRPYDGAPNTTDGIRGKTFVAGLTFRDIKDCFIKGALLACSGSEKNKYLYERAVKETWVEDDLYKIDWSKIDPIAVWQNMNNEIEKMMGIYPNIPQTQPKQKSNSKSNRKKNNEKEQQ